MNWSLKQRILRHVRIHGGDSNALARAMHCGVQKDTLMTNEKGLFAQAGLRNVRGSTIERKIMSTKTITKRIALVAASALAIGGFTAVSANAVPVALTAAYTFTASGTATNAATPVPTGTAITLTPTVTITGTSLTSTTPLSSVFVLKDPNGVDVTSTALCTAGADVTGQVTSISVAASTCTFASTIGIHAGPAGALGTIVFTPTIAGNYQLFAGNAVSTTTDNSIAAVTSAAATGTTSSNIVVSGLNVSQGTTLGSAGAAALANQAQVKVIYPIAAGTYKVTSSGVGSIGGVLAGAGVAAANTNVSGSATDYSQGVSTVSGGAGTTVNNLFTLLNPATAGVQTITLSSVATGTGISTTVASVTITWGALTNFSAGVSTAFMAGPAVTAALVANLTDANFTSTTDAVAETAARGTGTATNKIAQVEVILKNADGTVSNGDTVTASITGSGLVSVDTTAATANGNARSATSGVLAGNVAYVHINTDGTAGTGTVTISVTNTAGVTVTLATKTVTSYGAVSKLAVAATNYTIGKAGFPTGGSVATRLANTEIGGTGNTTTVNNGTSTPAFIIKSTDSAGNVANAASAPTVVSSDTTVISGGTCTLDVPAVAATDLAFSSGGTGFYNCNFSAASGAASGAKATLTIRITNPADSTGLTFLTTTVPVTVGGSVAKEVISTDKASYAPGEALNITVTATDSNGNPVFDGAPAVGAITSSKSLGGTAFAPAIYVGGKASSKSATTGVVSTFAPSVQGAFSLNATGTDAATKPLTASATVTDGSTTNAQIASLITKINALAALIAKIQKKLGVK